MAVCPIEQGDKFGREFGCGYPGDAVTKTWLRQSFDAVYGFPSIVRFSWSTSRKLLQVNGKDSVYWYDLIDEEKKNKQQGKGKQTKLTEQVLCKPANAPRKIKPYFSAKLQLKRDAYASL